MDAAYIGVMIAVIFTVPQCQAKIVIERCINGRVSITDGNKSVIACTDVPTYEPVTWTIRTLGATTERHLGTCSSTDEVCSSGDAKSYGLTRINTNTADESDLTILDNHREMFSENSVKCADASSDFAACIISVIPKISMTGCTNGSLPIKEGNTNVIECTNLPSTKQVTWTARKLGAANETTLGTCEPQPSQGVCFDFKSYGLTRPTNEASLLTIKDNLREIFSETSVQCASDNDLAACNIRVIHPATKSQCSIYSHNTTLTGSCRVDKAFSSDGNYSCQWSILHPNTSSAIMMPSVLIVTDYSDSGKQYYQGVCSFSYPLPQTNGAYTLFFSMFPCGPNFAEVGQFTMHPPDQPVITGYTTGQILELGHRLEMVCTVHGGSPKVSSIDFTCTGFDDGADTSNETSVSSSVIIPSISEADDQRSKTYDHPRRRREEDTHPYTGLRPPGADGASASGTVNPQGVYEEIEAEQRPQFSTGTKTIQLQQLKSQGRRPS
ncbi:hypothetical protein BaRGS_00036292 [Batillaria attramentaria]|uniref:Ig-like domain-containing protein n=1 Tax=Batillaria attramentaria TaxID=370345 RepID=A0ABD0JCH1_9CAEN